MKPIQLFDLASSSDTCGLFDKAALSDAPGFGATRVVDQLRAGVFSARDYALALLGRVRELEAEVGAWTRLDPNHLLAQADAADEMHRAGTGLGALHGVPVGIKDIIDTADLPTENGTVLHAGRQPRQDAEIVRRLRAAGGLVMGKTVTTELATYAPGKTRNPHHPGHTPGGSSSGSAAAVAAGMVPLAIGTQTNGSVIRPAAFCGVIGYKPSAGWISRSGILVQSPPLDQVGVFGRSVEDVALLVQCLAGNDVDDAATRIRATPPLLATARSEPPLPPTLAFVRTPLWHRLAPDGQAAFEALLELLASRMASFDLPESAAGALELHRTVMEADIAASFDDEYERGRAQLSDSLRGQIERGRRVTACDYRRALERRAVIETAFDTVFDHYDAILTPATLGTAPEGLTNTGDPAMCTLWTFLGQPAITLPLLHGANGLPLGVQLVGRRDDDARLLRTAQWLTRTVAAAI
jgi:Asp-tRNA(Asn)/Glu-tRNA(Gln) amidotransferase A subunit family amidase